LRRLVMGEVKCPDCGRGLLNVEYPHGSMLNEEQFESAKEGDFFCAWCKDSNTKTGYKYFWERDLKPTSEKLKACPCCGEELSILPSGWAHHTGNDCRIQRIDCPLFATAISPEKMARLKDENASIRSRSDACEKHGFKNEKELCELREDNELLEANRDEWREEWEKVKIRNTELQQENERLRERLDHSNDIMRNMATRLEQKSRWDIHDRKAVLNFLRATAALNDRALAAGQEGKNAIAKKTDK